MQAFLGWESSSIYLLLFLYRFSWPEGHPKAVHNIYAEDHKYRFIYHPGFWVAVQTSDFSLSGKTELNRFMNLGTIKEFHSEKQILAKIGVYTISNTDIKMFVGKLQRTVFEFWPLTGLEVLIKSCKQQKQLLSKYMIFCSLLSKFVTQQECSEHVIYQPTPQINPWELWIDLVNTYYLWM